MTDRDPRDLHPDLQPIYRKWVDGCHAAGLKVFLIMTWRSIAEQDAFYAEGRTVKSSVGPWTAENPLGSVVTHARGSESLHTYTMVNGMPASKAFDFGVLDENGRYITDGTDPRYIQAGKIGEGLGLVWGGSWPKPKTDFDHLQMG